MRRLQLLVCLLATVLAGVPALAASPRSWAQREIQLVTSRGLMGGDAASFRPDAPLTRGELAVLASALSGKPVARPARPAAAATIERLDRALVDALGLGETATALTAEAKAAGLQPPARLGSEALARLLGLRVNHPAAQDALERLPTQAASRAEAAFSAARILRFQGWEAGNAITLAGTFDLPALTAWQQRILRTAFRFVGYPYVWGGTSESTQTALGRTVPGGFDCSGYVWRVYKLEPYQGGEALSAALRGRTTFAMSSEVARAKRIPYARLAPADVLFFGTRGPSSTPSQVGHMGIYVGAGWFVHSSGSGVALAPLTGWYRSRFAWARRPLAEVRLIP